MKTKHLAAALLCAVVLAGPALPDVMQLEVGVYPAIRGPAASDPAKYGLDLQEVTRRLEESLRATSRFRLYERNQQVQDSIIKEQDFAQSERARSNAAAFGQLNNVAYLVQPFISEFRFAASFGDVAGLPGKYRRTDSGKLVVVYKVLDTTTGELKYQIISDAGFSFSAGVSDAKGGSPGPDLWIKMVDDVSRKGADAIANSLFPIEVVRYEDGQLFVNRGEGTGLKVGELWGLFETREPLIDPNTGKNLGSTEFPIGKVKVLRILPGFSVFQPVGELKKTPKPGDILRKE